VVETLRVAAPWQAVRRRERAGVPSRSPRVEVRRDDFRVARFRQRSATTTIFAVDASGSSALHRMAEAKGAVELLLAECYVRRDRVALIAFRDRSAELVLPPTSAVWLEPC
jgi:magnesium chelatase subunit D